MQGSTDLSGLGLTDFNAAAAQIEEVASQTLEVLLTLVGSPKLAALLDPMLNDVVYTVARFMQMSEQMLEEIDAGDPNQLLGNDADGASIRATGDILFDEIAGVSTTLSTQTSPPQGGTGGDRGRPGANFPRSASPHIDTWEKHA